MSQSGGILFSSLHTLPQGAKASRFAKRVQGYFTTPESSLVRTREHKFSVSLKDSNAAPHPLLKASGIFTPSVQERDLVPAPVLTMVAFPSQLPPQAWG